MKNPRTATIEKEIADLIDTLNTDKADILSDKYPEDRLHEYADSAVPIYNRELAEMLANDTSLAECEDDGLAEGVTDVFKRIQIAVYERLSTAAHQWLCEAQGSRGRRGGTRG